MITLGTRSHGTLRIEDLLPVFHSALAEVDADCAARYADDVTKALALLADDDIDTDFADDLLRDLGDSIDTACPEGVYFGSTEGDGSDFGFWADAVQCVTDGCTNPAEPYISDGLCEDCLDADADTWDLSPISGG